ncbi:hypothetical protein Bpfe_031039 [Biomphalaria pfeifferi]|uniref:Uncharacterized protein n=1 Tax=Biomphalaria pfeifferi TaxID=112525 RepID=A0AAD8ANL5_BIOPF|nr:hypothetical protein Bpfe_031039 [Biomphalaria pfeifferi]
MSERIRRLEWGANLIGGLMAVVSVVLSLARERNGDGGANRDNDNARHRHGNRCGRRGYRRRLDFPARRRSQT